MIGFLSFLYGLLCIIIILLILIQKGKSSLGMGSITSSQQALFGGAGGQDFFQKLTWVLGAILIFGSLGLAMLRTKNYSEKSKYISSMASNKKVEAPISQQPEATAAQSDTQDKPVEKSLE